MDATLKSIFLEVAGGQHEVIASGDNTVWIPMIGGQPGTRSGAPALEPHFIALRIGDLDDGPFDGATVVAHDPFKIMGPRALAAEGTVCKIAAGETGIGEALEGQRHFPNRTRDLEIGDAAVGVSVVGTNGIGITGRTHLRDPMKHALNAFFAIRCPRRFGIPARFGSAGGAGARRGCWAFRMGRSQQGGESETGGEYQGLAFHGSLIVDNFLVKNGGFVSGTFGFESVEIENA